MSITIFSVEQLQMLINGVFVGIGTAFGSFILMSFFVKIFEKNIKQIFRQERRVNNRQRGRKNYGKRINKR